MQDSKRQIWISMIKSVKESVVRKNPNASDLAPAVIVERGDDILGVIVAPIVDRDLGLRAATIARISCDPSRLILVFDAHYASGKQGETPEEFVKRYPPGSMQRACDEDGACERGEISDCLICNISSADSNELLILPYSYHGPETQFQWKEPILDHYDQVSGIIPNHLRSVWNLPLMVDSDYLKSAGEALELDRERQIFHTSRMGFHHLTTEGYAVVDLVSPHHPEWLQT